jgi:hypothetical protein
VVVCSCIGIQCADTRGLGANDFHRCQYWCSGVLWWDPSLQQSDEQYFFKLSLISPHHSGSRHATPTHITVPFYYHIRVHRQKLACCLSTLLCSGFRVPPSGIGPYIWIHIGHSQSIESPYPHLIFYAWFNPPAHKSAFYQKELNLSCLHS